MASKPIVAGVTAVATLAVAAVVAFLVWPASSEPVQPRMVTVKGQITLTTTHVYHWAGTPGEECYGTGPYRDMVEGAQVKVYDAAGTVLAIGKLEQGHWFDSCVFLFKVRRVPQQSMIQVQVATRGMVPVEWADVTSDKVELTLGP